ncbi:MAG: hypothetical protein IKP24_04390 [Alphaproteobacteria bacterium]|nr:hypothetical protein [Alphaproteobacteria bacterium]
MKYPDDFNTPAFPAGKFVAVSRFMATAIMVIFFIIICLCGLIFWVKKTQDVSPFLISISPNGERWTMVAHDNHKTEIPAYYVLQESVLNKFAHNWFTISGDTETNKAVWANCAQTPGVCRESGGNNSNTCAIYCACDASVYDSFERVVLPVYSGLIADTAAVWKVINVSVAPVDSLDSIKESGGKWKLNVVVQTDNGIINFTGFAQTGLNEEQYPKTMGYYVTGFNMYRMN